MEDFKGLLNFYIILFFVVPGIVIVFIRSKFINGRMPSVKENVLSFITISVVYYAFSIFFIEFARDPGIRWVWRTLIWFSLILIGPAVIGLLLGVAAQRDWFTRVANKLNLAIVHVIPTAWDWKFSRVNQGQFVMVTLSSDEKVAGYFGGSSFASSDAAERDLYIEEEYTVSEADIWEPRQDKVGILIPAKEIKFIEFWEPKGLRNDG